jgi:hypothetical protein
MLESEFLDFHVINVPESESLSDQLRGQNQRNVLVVFQCDTNNEELEAFLGKILAAVQLDLTKDTTLLKLTANQRFSFTGLHRAHDLKTVIAFGIAAERMGVQFATPLYQPIRHEGVTFLFSDDLEKIYEERQAGGKKMSASLWKALKEIFS